MSTNKAITPNERRMRNTIREIIKLAGPDGCHKDRLIETARVSYKLPTHVTVRVLGVLERDGIIERIGMGNRYRLAVQS